MLGLILDNNYHEPLHPIHSGPLAGPAIEIMGRNGLGYVAADDNPLGMTDDTKGHIVVGVLAAGALGLFLWKHKTGKKMFRGAKKALGLGRSRRRR